MTSVLDKWLRLKCPDQFTADQLAKALQHTREALERTGIPEEARRTGRDEGELIDERARERMSEMIRTQDTGGLLASLGISPGELIASTRQQGHRAQGGRNRAAHTEDALDCALRAFLEVDLEHGEHREAIQRALTATESLPHPPSEKTVRKWLSEIIGGPWCAIQPPRRGRPKNQLN